MNRRYFILSILCVLFSLSIYSQQSPIQVRGKIQGEGASLPYVHVMVKGTNIGTITDEEGLFQFSNLKEGPLTLVASAIGYQQEEFTFAIEPNETREINFDLNPDALGLDEIVVSSNRNQVNRKEAPVIINSISTQLFETAQAICIADGLDFSPGLRMECNCQNCGFSQVRMNGLEGPYSQILINSRPIFSGLAGVYGLELIPVNMVDRIEVVRGGGSALFGGNAIAGTVNIITKEPKSNTFSLESRLGFVGLGGHEGTSPALDRTLNINGSIVNQDQTSGLFLYGLLRDRDAYDENGDDFSEMVLLKNTTLGLSAFQKTGEKGKLGLDLYHINEFRRGGNKFDYLPHEADITEQLRHNIMGASLTFDLFTNDQYDKLSLYASLQSVDRASYYGAEQDPNAYGQTDDLSGSLGGQYTLNVQKLAFAPANVVLGIDHNFNTLKDVKLGSEGNPNTILTDQFVNTIGTFVQSDWKTKIANISLGLRVDNYLIRDNGSDHEETQADIMGTVFAPRANVLFNISTSFRYRVSYAKGYRAPQLFDEDLHIEATGARRILHGNSPNLTQETSHSFTSSVNTDFFLGNIQSEFLVEGFYTKLIDPFSNEYSETEEEGVYQYTRINAEDGAYVAGANFELNTILSATTKLQIGLTVQKSEYETAQFWGEGEESYSKHFMRTPNQYGFMTFEWLPSEKFSLSVSGTYTGKMYVPHFGLDPETDVPAEIAAIERGDVITGERLEKSESFLHLGGRLGYHVPVSEDTHLELYLGIQNIFNQTQKEHDSGVYRDAAYIYGPCKPRTLTVGAILSNLH